MEVPCSLTDVELDRAVIDPVIESLKEHGRVTLGERGDIGLDKSRAILEAAL